MHLAEWPQISDVRLSDEEQRCWGAFGSMRDKVMKALEDQRSRGVIGSPLEAQVTLVASEKGLEQLLDAYRDTLAEAFIVSEVCVAKVEGAGAVKSVAAESSIPGLASVKVERAPGAKCQRCWKYRPSVGSHLEHPQLCARCISVVKTQ